MSEECLSMLPDDIGLIDIMHLGRPEVIGTYLLRGAEPVLIDPGPSSTLENLESGLAAAGLALQEMRSILLTHIHLDHAGGAGTLVSRYPQLRVYVHRRGAPHLIAPERLIVSATRLYGEAMDLLWGEILPVPEENVIPLDGGERLACAGRELLVLDAPGHASHHLFYVDEGARLAFVGDAAGVRLPGQDYVQPPTPPPDIDLEAWRRTLGQLRELDLQLLLPTHFGPAPAPAEHIDRFEATLLRWAEVVRAGLEQGEEQALQVERLRALADIELDQAGPHVRARYEQATPLEHNWLGLARYWRKRLL